MPRRVKIPSQEELQTLTKSELQTLKSDFDTIREEIEDARKKSEKRASELWLAKFATLKRADIDLIVPEHERTSCSDNNIVNGFGSTDSYLPRCNRCAFLELLLGDVYIPDGKRLEISVSFSLIDL